MTFLNSYIRKRVIITGHTGFKGSWLSIWLSKLGAEVYGYSLSPNTTPNNYSVSSVRSILSGERIGDISDKGLLFTLIKEVEPDYIFHLAAQPLVRASYHDPILTFQTNVIGSLNVLDAVRILEQPCSVIMVTSDKCYKNYNQIWGYRECDPLGGHDPYSASKAAAEIAISSYRQSFFPVDRMDEHGVQIATARSGNVIGGGDWAADRIIPDAVRALSATNNVQVRNPHAVRPWQHVLEPLSGYLTLGARMYKSRDPMLSSAWNFGPIVSKECSVAQLMDLFCAEWGEGSFWVHQSEPHAPSEAGILRLSIDKAVNLLSWMPRWDLHKTVYKTVAWYKEFYFANADMLDYSLQDITAYMDTMK